MNSEAKMTSPFSILLWAKERPIVEDFRDSGNASFSVQFITNHPQKGAAFYCLGHHEDLPFSGREVLWAFSGLPAWVKKMKEKS
ncbi:hypothetical protein JRQ81_006689, partial [Phrynocephalus forsythii]